MFDWVLNTPLLIITKLSESSITKACNQRSSPSEVFLGKSVLKICSKFTREHPCRRAISVKLLCNFIEITLWHRCSPVNLLHIFRTLFPKNTSLGLLLQPKLSSSFYTKTRKSVVFSFSALHHY